jgi:thiol:disulfide interchange protein
MLPVAAFLFGPALEAVAPESISSHLLLSVLPTVLPLAALVVVAVVSYRRTGSAARALRLTALAFAVAVLGAIAYLLHVWSEASGS